VRAVFLLILLAGLLAGCAGSEKLPQAHGPLFVLNPGLWQPTPAELQDPPKVGPR
jgi:hypothetical protein